MMFQRFRSWLIKIALAYLLLGGIYYLLGFLFHLMEGQQIIFSPAIGLPLTVIGWPQMLRADFLHWKTLGLRAHSIVTALLAIFVFFYLIRETAIFVKSLK